MGRGDGATDAGDARGNGPTLLLLFDAAVPDPCDPLSAACTRWYVGSVGVGAGALLPFIMVDAPVLDSKSKKRHIKREMRNGS